MKTEIQAFNDILDAAIPSVPVCGEDVEFTARFTYLGSDIHVSTCELEVNRHLGRSRGVMDSLDHGVVALLVSLEEGESATLLVLGASSLALWI